MIGPTTAAGVTPPKPDPHAALRKVSQQLEAVFLNQLLQSMRATVPQDGIAPASQGEQMFTAMMDEHVAQAAAERSRGGLSEALYRQLSRMLPAETPK